MQKDFDNIFVNNRSVAFTGNKIYALFDATLSKELERYALPFSFERILIDSRMNKWFGSFDKGLYFIGKNAGIKVQLPVGKEEGLLQIVPDGDQLYLNTEKNGMLMLAASGKVSELIYKPGMNRMKGYARMGTERIIGTDNGLYKIGIGNNSAVMLKHMAVKDMETEDHKTLLVGLAAGAGIFKINGRDSFQMMDEERTTAIYRYNDNEWWLGGLNGLRRCTLRGGKYETEKLHLNNEIDNSRISDIKRDLNGNMWVATDQKGLFFCHRNGKIIHISETSPGRYRLISDVCIQLEVAADNRIWVATRGGISVIEIKDGMPFKVSGFSIPEGMPGKDINSIAFWQNRIYISSSEGLFYFEKFPQLVNETSATQITGVMVNKKEYLPGNLQLDHYQNNFFIRYASSFINTGTAYNFRFRIKELNNNWATTHTCELPLLGLDPGDYTIEIAAVNSHGDAGKVAVMHIAILPPWYKRWWFIAAVVTVSLTVILYYLLLIRDRVVMAKRLALLRLRILRAQMNPHFVFNALSNIQHLIQIRKLDDADEYIGTLSQIMRKSIDYSGKEFIQLDNEIDYTVNYLEIEKMRFRNKFDFVLDCQLSREEMQTVFVPPLILQPIVENAIKHAFKGIKYKGEIKVIVSKPGENELKYEITDNGCGFNMEGSHKHLHGLDITEERLSILFKGGDNKSRLKITSHTEAPSGTTVVIEIPVMKD